MQLGFELKKRIVAYLLAVLIAFQQLPDVVGVPGTLDVHGVGDGSVGSAVRSKAYVSQRASQFVAVPASQHSY